MLIDFFSRSTRFHCNFSLGAERKIISFFCADLGVKPVEACSRFVKIWFTIHKSLEGSNYGYLEKHRKPLDFSDLCVILVVWSFTNVVVVYLTAYIQKV